MLYLVTIFHEQNEKRGIGYFSANQAGQSTNSRPYVKDTVEEKCMSKADCAISTDLIRFFMRSCFIATSSTHIILWNVVCVCARIYSIESYQWKPFAYLCCYFSIFTYRISTKSEGYISWEFCITAQTKLTNQRELMRIVQSRNAELKQLHVYHQIIIYRAPQKVIRW